ncbi:mCG142586 [Mus musculus]|nr:mCG142586 [Mus musculus]
MSFSFRFVLCDSPRRGKHLPPGPPPPSIFAFIQMAVFIKAISKYTENSHAQLQASYFEEFSAAGSAKYLEEQSHQYPARPAS